MMALTTLHNREHRLSVRQAVRLTRALRRPLVEVPVPPPSHDTLHQLVVAALDAAPAEEVRALTASELRILRTSGIAPVSWRARRALGRARQACA